MKSLLRENVAAFAAGFRASMKQKKQMQMQAETCGNSLYCTAAAAIRSETCEQQPHNSGSEESLFLSMLLDGSYFHRRLVYFHILFHLVNMYLQVKWRQEQKAKEQALVQRSKEATEASNKRKVESLRFKIAIDFQRHKDDLQRLEQELSRLNRASSTDSSVTSHTKGKSDKTKGEAMSKLLEELDRLDGAYEKEANYDRECLICNER